MLSNEDTKWKYKNKNKNSSFREGYDGPVQKKVTFQPSGTVVVST